MRNKSILFTVIATVISALLFTGCDKEEDPNNELVQLLEDQVVEIESYLEINNITAEEVNGYYVEMLAENADGEAPEPNDIVGIYYEITTLDGQLVEKLEEGSSSAAIFPFMRDRVLLPIALYDLVANMNEGEEVRAFLPFDVAYRGFSLVDRLPAYSAVIIKLKLAEVMSEAELKVRVNTEIKQYLTEEGLLPADSLESGVYYSTTEEGTAEKVGANSVVSLRYSGKLLSGKEFDNNTDAGDQAYDVNMSKNEVIAGFKNAVANMSLNEKGVALLPFDQAYGSGYYAVPYKLMEELAYQRYVPSTFIDIPPYATLRFDLEVEEIN
ncbi:FKBP-type peptidyl-prolyl cis-trans isomerase [Porifericola rhodea]|uniref:FKBP-type peptidyl-prolyl cis-trans isomerase n=1 Tax=Porifericola rhodea TaxID=930972 RepID=UPI0026651F9C|nr:FKBP-type peptidyl-prolyl cis-trans isomerase [Porifericola rhodea]WKN32867.1 FKBP-type peptidyl-prolyl cis-trans isomerase [Porifericola rhodea]